MSPIATARAEKILDAAPAAGIDLFRLELVRRRLSHNERECARLPRGPRRRELEAAILADIAVLCLAIRKLMDAADAGRHCCRGKIRKPRR